MSWESSIEYYRIVNQTARDRLSEAHGIEVLVPDEAGRGEVHRVIYEELCAGRIAPASRARYLEIIEGLVARGAEGIVFGCTEVGLLLKAPDVSVPVFDTTEIHAIAAVEEAL